MSTSEDHQIVPISIPGIHQAFYPWFKKHTNEQKIKVLDAGAGHGAFTKKLHEDGYEVAACDLYPEYYRYKEVPCKQADISKELPFGDEQFDAVISIEVMEHIPDHKAFFSESSRVLKKGGKLFVSTPNILSLKSRIRFLFSGFYYSFQPLELKNYDGLQHVASLTPDQYNYIALQYGFKPAILGFDKKQSTSKWLMFLYPFMLVYTRLKKTGMMHNRNGLLTGRVMFMMFEKE